MAGPAIEPLVVAGPFLGIDLTTADIYVPPTKGNKMFSGDCEIIPKALTAKAGRVNLFTVSGLHGGVIGAIAQADAGIVVGTGGNLTSSSLVLGSVPTSAYSAGVPARFTWQVGHTPYIPPYETNAQDLPFTQAVSINSPLYGNITTSVPSPLGYPISLTTPYTATLIDNYGTQTLLLNRVAPADFAHFNAPNYVLATNSPLALSVSNTGGLNNENVWYALTFSAYGGPGYPNPVGANVPVIPGGSGAGFTGALGASPQGQETSPLYPSTTNLTATSPAYTTVPLGISLNAIEGGVVLTPQNGFQWWGAFPNDSGIGYVTNIYRYTSALPVWNFIATVAPGTVTTSTSAFTDVAPDTYANLSPTSPLLPVSANGGPQLTFNRDVPPVKPFGDFVYATTDGYYPGAPMTYHQERVWYFALVSNTDTNNSNQLQLWYSNAGRGWEFDKVNNVFLVDLPSLPTYPFGLSGTYPLSANSNPYVFPYNTYVEVPSAIISLTSVALFWTTRRMYILYGNDPSTYFFQKFADIGCTSPNSVAYANTEDSVGAFWMSESGIYYTNAQGIKYISEPIRSMISELSLEDIYTAVGFYRDHTYYISFPLSYLTWAFKTTTGQWHGPMEYATTCAVDIPSDPVTLVNNSTQSGPLGPMNSVIAVNPLTAGVDSWFASPYTDLGYTQTVTYKSNDQIGPNPHTYKTFLAVGITHENAPSSGQICQVEVVVDDDLTKKCTVSFDLSQGPTQIATLSYGGLGGGDLQGFLASIQITFSTTSEYNPVIKNVTVYGNGAQYNLTPTVNMSTAGLS